MSSQGLTINFRYGKTFVNKDGKQCIEVIICEEVFIYLLNGYTAEGIPILGKEITNG